MADWSRPFDESIQPPKGKKLVTLKDVHHGPAQVETAGPATAGGGCGTAQSAQADDEAFPPPATRKLTPRE
jgi:hypothetical protein